MGIYCVFIELLSCTWHCVECKGFTVELDSQSLPQRTHTDDMCNREAAARWSTKGQVQDSRALVNSVSATIFICFSKRSFPTLSTVLCTQEAGLLLLLHVIAAPFFWLHAELGEHP